MIIFPAIDLKQGKCVRLFKGNLNEVTIFNNSPSNQALEFEKYGFKFIHVVDLDGAVNGITINQNSVKEILQNIKIPVQLGGGIRDIATIEKWLKLGVNRVILGTVAIKNPDIVKEACREFPNQIVVGIDSVNGMVATEGWLKTNNIGVVELAKQFEDCGVSAIIYTDINRDGTLSGTDIEGSIKLTNSLSIPIIISGGISNIKEVIKIRNLKNPQIAGVIIGRAIYDKKVSIEDLIKLNS
jgi:phosphoribosylformimino-5-aminoimidazole carboxamide ribotide isomerase